MVEDSTILLCYWLVGYSSVTLLVGRLLTGKLLAGKLLAGKLLAGKKIPALAAGLLLTG